MNETYHRYKLAIDVYTVGSLCLFGITGNIISIAVLGHDRSIRRTTGFLLQMLALSDIVYLVTCFFYQTVNAVEKLTDWMSPDASRRWAFIEPFTWPCASIAQTCTVWLVVVLTADRYVAICKPLHSPQYSTMSRAREAVVVVWTIAVVYNLPRFFERIVVEATDPVTGEIQFVVQKTRLRNHPVYVLVYKTCLFFVVRFFVPFSALAFFNTRLVQAIRESALINERTSVRRCDSPGANGGGGGRLPRSRSELYTLTLVVVVIVFVICAIPDLLLRLWLSVDLYSPYQVPIPKQLLLIVNCFSNMCLTVNSCVNFLIYCFIGKRFRAILAQIVCRGPQLSFQRTSAVVNSRRSVMNEDLSFR